MDEASSAQSGRVLRSEFPAVQVPAVPLTTFVLREAATRGTTAAFVDAPTGRTLTYADLLTGVVRCAAGLAAHGLGSGDVLAIFSPNIPEYAIAFHAAATLGAATTTVNPLYTPRELAQQLRDSRATLLLTVPPLLETVRAALPDAPGVTEVFVFGSAEGAISFATLLREDWPPPPPVEFDPATTVVALPYSSGTTGLPKGVMLTHTNLLAQLALIDGRPDTVTPRAGDVLLAFLPFFHIYGIVTFLNQALVRGATVISIPRFDLAQYLELVQRYRVSYLHLVPPVVLALAKHPLVDQYDVSSVRWGISAAAPLSAQVIDAFHARLPAARVAQAYGMTEVSGASHVATRDPARDKPAAGGLLLPNTECVIVDTASGVPLGRNESGEIWVRGPQVMLGYLNQPAATATTIDADGWLHTGDIGYVDEDGFIFIVDRVKELIKYKGLQVAPAELEAILLSHPAVADAAVIPSPDDAAGEVPKAYVVTTTPVPAEELMAFVAERVAPHKRIRRLQFIEAIPKSSAGKILRRTLIEQERGDAPAGSA